MGRDKALLAFERGPNAGLRLIDRQGAVLSEALGCAPADLLVSGEVEGFVSVPDLLPGLGPLGGIAAVLARLEAGTRAVFLPVDLARISARALRRLAFEVPGEDALRFENQELPLRLTATNAVRDEVGRLCAEGVPPRQRSVRELLARLGARSLGMGDVDPEEFLNANTPEEWERAGA